MVPLVDFCRCHAGWQASHSPRCRLAYAYKRHGIRGPSFSGHPLFIETRTHLRTDCDDAMGPRTDIDPCTQNLDL
jgi:hypothetical protein